MLELEEQQEKLQQQEWFMVIYRDPDPAKANNAIWGDVRGVFHTEARAKAYIEDYKLFNARVRKSFF